LIGPGERGGSLVNELDLVAADFECMKLLGCDNLKNMAAWCEEPWKAAARSKDTR